MAGIQGVRSNIVVGDMGAATMFSGLRAWFSINVQPANIRLWEACGGVKSPFETADYLFSCDATSVDTAKIFSNPIYLKLSAAIIHPSYIHACLFVGDASKVALFSYILNPKDVQEDFQLLLNHNNYKRFTKYMNVYHGSPNKIRKIEDGEDKDGNAEDDPEVIVIEDDSDEMDATCNMKENEAINFEVKQQSIPASSCQVPLPFGFNQNICDIVDISQLKKVTGQLQIFCPAAPGFEVRYKQ